MRKRCIFKEHMNCGAQIFWFEPCKSGDPEFDNEYVAVFYLQEGGDPFVRMHRSNLIEVPDNIGAEKRWGIMMPADDWLKSVWNEFKTKEF